MIVALLIVVILLAVLGLLFYWLKTKKSVKAKEENVNYGFNIRSNSGNLEPLNLSNKVRFLFQGQVSLSNSQKSKRIQMPYKIQGKKYQIIVRMLEDMPTYAYTYSPKVFRFYHKIDRDAILFSLDKISEIYFDIITSNINDGAGTEFMVVIYE